MEPPARAADRARTPFLYRCCGAPWRCTCCSRRCCRAPGCRRARFCVRVGVGDRLPGAGGSPL